MTGARFLDLATGGALVLLTLALVLTIVRIARGPSLPDRVLGLDLLTTLATGFIGVFAVRTGFTLYVDIAIALCLVAFLTTVALARYIVMREGKAPAPDKERKGRAQ